MNTTYKKCGFAAMAAVMIWAAALPVAIAQDTSQGTVVVYPVVFNRNSGSKTSRETAVRTVDEMLQKGGYTLISSTVAENTWRQMGFRVPMHERPARREDVVAFGAALHARYVVQPVFDFNSRSIWVDLGPRTVSTATVDLVITDVTNNSIAYEKRGVTGRSDEKFDLAKAGADLILTPFVTVVSGGPKTPHEQRAVQIAVFKALRHFVRPTEAE